ncbi:meiotically upregulated Mug174 [Schizosaccharomyces cryophilus OY26]|uniref:Meiotically upregulated Mug174 n=1 Tax=Schizosaccharomyces cryophilus (strain OY26 / ATCC MYA-4695 / CBS 11777 / NBRC 106824 / NRRL Y48691) TaxID=653667 RepID=S9X880_SCHCR|nr:meiotically upregulated Mug174 [Schizosaccharomyces cryophilus OY26]EPY49996.1 meiotically upregulated Mug174 [Schizosaccharomyces cryophilus OY26]
MLLRIRSCEPLIPMQQWIHTAELNLSDKTSSIADLLYSILLFNFGDCKDGRSILVGPGNQAKYALGNELFLQLVKDDFALPISMAYHLFLSDSEVLELRALPREEALLRGCEVMALRLSSSTSLDTALQEWSNNIQGRGSKAHLQNTQAPKPVNMLVSSSLPYATPNNSDFSTKKRDAAAPSAWNDTSTSKKSKLNHSTGSEITFNPMKEKVNLRPLALQNQHKPIKNKESPKKSSPSESSESDASSEESSSAVSVSVSSDATSVSTAATSSETESSESSSSSDESTSNSDSSSSDSDSSNSEKLDHYIGQSNDVTKSNTSGFSHSLNTANEMSYFRDSSALHTTNQETLCSGSTMDGERTTLFDSANFLKSSPNDKAEPGLEHASDIVYKRFGDLGTDSVEFSTSDFRSAEDKNDVSNHRSFHELDNEDLNSSTSVQPPGSGSSATKSRNLRRKKSRLLKKYGQDIESMPGDLGLADRSYITDESKVSSEGQTSTFDSDTIKVDHSYNAVPISKSTNLDVEFPPGSLLRFTIMDLNANTYTPEISEKSGRVITSNDKEVKVQLDTKHRYKIKYGSDGEIIRGRFGTIPDEQLVEGIATYGWDLMSDIHKLVKS